MIRVDRSEEPAGGGSAERRLAAALLLLAVREVRGDITATEGQIADSRHWLQHDQWCGELCDWLGISRPALLARLGLEEKQA